MMFQIITNINPCITGRLMDIMLTHKDCPRYDISI